MIIDDEALRRAHAVARQQVSQDKWDKVAEAIVKDRQAVEAHLQADPPQDGFRSLLAPLRSSSFVHLPLKLQNVRDVRKYLEQFPVFKGPHPHTFPGSTPLPIEEARTEFPILSYRWEQVLRAPGLIDQLNDPRLIDLIESYLGCVPTLHGLNAFWSFPAEKPELYYSQYF